MGWVDRTVPFTAVEVLIPMAVPYRPLSVASGQVALGLLVLVLLSTYAKRRIGTGAWRRIHRVAFVAWAAATVHAIMAGSDTGIDAVALMYISSAAVVLGLTTTRIVAAIAARRADTIGT